MKCDKCKTRMDCKERKVWDANAECEVEDMFFICPNCKAIKEIEIEG